MGGYRIQRGEHPHDCAHARIRTDGEQAGMLFGQVQDDRAGFEQDLVALLPGGNLSEGIPRQVGRLLHFGEGQQLHVIGHAQFLQRPAHAHVTGQALAAVGGGGKGGEDGGHRGAPAGGKACLFCSDERRGRKSTSLDALFTPPDAVSGTGPACTVRAA